MYILNVTWKIENTSSGEINVSQFSTHFKNMTGDFSLVDGLVDDLMTK